MNLQGFAIAVIAVVSMAPVFMNVAAQDRERDGAGRGGAGRGSTAGAASREVTRILELLGLAEIKKELEVSLEQDRALRKLAEQTLETKPAHERFKLGEMSDQERRETFDRILAEQAARVREMKQKLREVLQPAQIKRFEQISLQLRGVLALADPQVQEELEITAEQISDLTKVRDEVHAKMRERASQFLQLGDREAMHKAFAEMREEVERQAYGVLTAGQRARLEEMKGEPFELPLRDLVRRDR